jgi:hypothetical protein
LFDARVFNLQASSAGERRHQDRRQPLQAARTA